MSDIYLAITETPTVVTLTSAVISSAVASTVTVANVVTVALDANSLSALENVTVTVGAAITGTVTVGNFPATQPVSIASVTIGSLPAISGTVTANVPLSVDGYTAVTGIRVTGCGHDGGLRVEGINPSNLDPANLEEGGGIPIFSVNNNPLPISGTVTVGNTVTIAGVVTANVTTKSFLDGLIAFAADETPLLVVLNNSIPAGTNQIGSVTVGNSVTIGSLPAISGTVTANIPDGAFVVAGIASDEGGVQPFYGVQLGFYDVALDEFTLVDSSNPLPISGTVTANTFALQGTAVTTSNFTSTTASTLLAGFNATRQVLTIFNEGASNLFVCVGATCTTIQYQVRLSSGDYYEVPNHQTTITHSAVFATGGGTARVTQVS